MFIAFRLKQEASSVRSGMFSINNMPLLTELETYLISFNFKHPAPAER